MNEKKESFFLQKALALCLAGLFLLTAPPLSAQNVKSDDAQQVYLTFRYKGAVNRVITAYYKNGRFYLPVVSLFELLGIDHQAKPTDFSVEGFYLNIENKYSLYFRDTKHYTIFADERYELPFKTFLIKELDYYLVPAKFQQIFGLNFSVNFNALSLELKTDKAMPVVAALKRKRQRELIQDLSFGHENYPLLFGRDRSWLAGGYLDYTLSANITSAANVYTYGFNLGAEALGGDVEGQIFGSYSSDFSTFRVNNLRYHFVTDKGNPYITQFSAGQLLSEGLVNNTVLGVRVSNEPVIPRVLFDSYVVNGTTIPGTEVELYLNNALVGFQVADGLGNYRFKIPLTYGRSRIRIQIYGPGGQIITRNEQVNVPFNFLPAGEVNYNITAGRLNNPVLGVSDSSFTTQGAVSAGLTSWLSVTAGADYFSGSSEKKPVIYSGLSARFFSNYNLSAKIAPKAFYKVTGSAIYPSLISWRLSYTYFNKNQGLYNFLGNNQQLRGSLFLPFSVGRVPLNLRFFVDRQFRNDQNYTRYRVNLNTQINKFNLRFGYRDIQIGSFTFEPTRVGEFTASATYNISRNPNMPLFLRGSFIRANATYNPYFKQIEQVELNISRSFFNEGYIQLNFARNFINDFNVIGFNISFDFNNFRTNTSFRRIRGNSLVTTSLRGSVGFDPYRNEILLMNRQQSGQAGASFRLYVDENGSGKYNPGERLLTENPIRLNRASGAFVEKDSVIYLTQLRPYDRYDVDIYKGVIKNPLLVPAFEKFSFIADPNRYKPIGIPFFMSGVISGKVLIKRGTSMRPVSGLTVIVENQKGDFQKTLRTFIDGYFYSYEIPPGNYSVRIDSSQLAFLNAKPKSARITFSVEAEPRGDFIEGLVFTLIPVENEIKEQNKKHQQEKEEVKVDKKENQVKSQKPESKITSNEKGIYAVQVSAWRTKDKAVRLANVWRTRGFEDTFTAKFVNGSTAQTWYRVRLGKFFTLHEALELEDLLKEKYQIEGWIIKAQ